MWKGLKSIEAASTRKKGKSRKKTEQVSLFNTLSFPNPHWPEFIIKRLTFEYDSFLALIPFSFHL